MLIFVLKIALTIPVTVALVYPFLGYSENVGVFHEVQTAGSVGAVAIALFFLFLVFLYCRDLHRSLSFVQPELRTASPRSVWLMLLLPYNFVEDFFIIWNVSVSLEREAQHNQVLQQFQTFGLVSGLGWCVAQIVSLVPHTIGFYAGLVAIPCWIVHWRFIRKVNCVLSQPAQANPAFQPTAHSSG